MMVCWTFTRKLTPVLMKLSERWPKYAYGHIISLWRINLSLLSCFPQLFFKYGSESTTGAKAKGHEMMMMMKVVCGANVPRVRKFHGAKVLGTFAPEERKFRGCESSMERKFSDFSLPVSECSTERKLLGSETSLYGLFAPGNESAEKRKVRIPRFRRRTIPVIIG